MTGPFPGFPVALEGDDVSELIDAHRDELPFNDQLPTFDPPVHTAHRALLARMITPKRLKENEEFMWRLADRVYDEALVDGRCEFNGDFASPFAMLVIADLLGVPESDHASSARRCLEGHAGTIGSSGGDSMEHSPLEYLYGKFSEYITERRANPRDDVLTGVASAAFPDGGMPEVIDAVRVAANLFAAGQETTVRLLSAAVMMLAEDPALQAKLRADRDLIPRFVEETLRFESPVRGDFRLSKCPVTVGGVEVPAGTTVMLVNAAANRDPRKFDRPGRLRHRTPQRPQPHRVRARAAQLPGRAARARRGVGQPESALLTAPPTSRSTRSSTGPPDDRRYTYLPTFILRGLTRLHIRFTPAEIES